MSLIGELNRRNVLHAGVAYLLSAWLIIQVGETIFPAFGAGIAAVRFVVIALAIELHSGLLGPFAPTWNSDNKDYSGLKVAASSDKEYDTWGGATGSLPVSDRNIISVPLWSIEKVRRPTESISLKWKGKGTIG